MNNSCHLLYSYRRCPYAMRARMALFAASIQCDVYEIDFKNKPANMLLASPKGTVPVLVMQDGAVIDESLDIMLWALAQNDPQNWLAHKAEVAQLIQQNDGAFKAALDRYKYPNRFPDEDCSNARQDGGAFLQELEERLARHENIFGKAVTMADIAIFPFVRQFANVDRAWFDALKLPYLQKWLATHLESDLFLAVMKKQKGNPSPLIL